MPLCVPVLHTVQLLHQLLSAGKWGHVHKGCLPMEYVLESKCMCACCSKRVGKKRAVNTRFA